jgi:hypothetical protein
VQPKKMHISIVGCLRNDRGKQKNIQQQPKILVDNNENLHHLEEINDVVDGDDDLIAVDSM